MLAPDVDAYLRNVGMTPSTGPWQYFELFPTGANIECVWAAPENPRSVRFYAWSALKPGEKDSFIGMVQQSGYHTETGADGTWLIPPEDTYPIDDGFLITEEWVAYADTRERIRDIVWAH